MNDVERQLMMPDQYKHVQQKLKAKYKKLFIVVKILIAVVVVLFTLTIYLAITQINNTEANGLKDQSNTISQNNIQLQQKNAQLQQQITNLDKINLNLQTNITKLQVQVNDTDQQINDLGIYINNNCDLMRQKLRLNDTNLNTLQISILPKSNDYTPIITFLNVSRNNLSKFCDNSLPNIEILDLTFNQIKNISYNSLNSVTELLMNQQRMVQQFSGNNLPLIKQLDLHLYEIVTFKGNIFSQLYYLNLDQNYITQISGYNISALQTLSLKGNPIKILENNNFPKLSSIAGMQDMTRLSRVVNNKFGKITNLQLNSNYQVLQFEQNSLPQLTFLKLSQCTYDYSKLISNSMPLLNKLQLNSNISNFQYFAQFRLLTQISINSIDIKSFSNHQYPNLQSIDLAIRQLASFENNKLPALEMLVIISASKLTDICKGNLMLNLKIVTLYEVVSISNINCLSGLEHLKVLELYSTHSIINFDNFQLPLLEKLILRGASLNSFQNNYLPLISDLTIQVNDAQLDLSNYTNLKSLTILAPLRKFSNYNLRELKILTIDAKNQATEFRNNVFSNLQEIEFNKFKYVPDYIQSYFPNLKILRIIDCPSQFDLKVALFAHFLQGIQIQSSNFPSLKNQNMFDNLQKLQINYGNLVEFQDNYFPKVLTMSLQYNALSIFTCRDEGSLDNLQYLYLNNNNLTDTIADSLIACNMKQLQRLYLQNNNIKDKQSLRIKLQAKYTSTSIYI